MSKLKKNIRKRRNKRLRRAYIEKLYSIVAKCALVLIDGKKMRRIGFPSDLAVEDRYLSFYIRQVNYPREIVAKGTLNDVEKYIHRLLNLKAFW